MYETGYHATGYYDTGYYLRGVVAGREILGAGPSGVVAPGYDEEMLLNAIAAVLIIEDNDL